ncbi:MAG TPA: hypothetical protein VNT76_05240, partial [Candidatus Binatus sp.]|nr:hypothetical protein [Candidatus Binatus sp.]
MKKGCKVFFSTAILMAGFAISTSALATPITATGAFNFRDERSANDINITAGDRITFGANSVVPNGDAGTTGIATQSTTVRTLNFDPAIGPNQFDASIAYNANRTGAWNLTFTNGADQSTIATPTIGST